MSKALVLIDLQGAEILGFACALAQDACATRNLQIGSTHVASEDVQAAFGRL